MSDDLVRSPSLDVAANNASQQQGRLRGSPSLTELRGSSRNIADLRSRSPSVSFGPNVVESSPSKEIGGYEALKLLAFENPGVVHSAANTKDETLRAFLAAEVGLDEIVKSAVAARKVGINQKNEQGYSLLHIACYRGYTPLVAFLVDQPGIDLELKSGFNNDSPLLLAVGNGHKAVTEKLLRSGASTPPSAVALAEKNAPSILPLLRLSTPPIKTPEEISPRNPDSAAPQREPTPEPRSVEVSPPTEPPNASPAMQRSGKLFKLKELSRQVGM